MLINPYKLLQRNGVSSVTLFLCASESFIDLLTSVGRGLLTIGLDLHAASDARVSLSSGQIGDVDESVVESRLDVADTEHVVGVLAGLGVGRAVVGHLLLLGLVRLLLCSRLNKSRRYALATIERIENRTRHTDGLARAADQSRVLGGAASTKSVFAPTILLLVLY